MIYFLIIGIFLLPFVLNSINAIVPKRKVWLNPSFFLIIILGFFQISLSWFTTTKINDYLAFSALSYLVLTLIILFLLSYLIAKFINNWELVNFQKIIKANYSSLVFGVLGAIPLIVVAINPSLTIFSDTQAYINASSYFYINGVYSFDGNNILDYTYTIPVGYYLNSVFSNLNFVLVYRFLWVACIFYLFNWTIYYFVSNKLSYLRKTYQLILSGFISAIYVCLSFVSIYIFTSGNLEMQTLFVVVSFILLVTKNAKYLWITCFAFLLFSTTALILSSGILLLGLIYLFFKGSWADFISFLIAVTSILVIGICFGLNELAGSNYQFQYFGIVSFSIIVLIPIFFIFYNKKNQTIFYFLNKQIISSKFKLKISENFSQLLKINKHSYESKKKWFLSIDRIKQISLLIFYIASCIAAFWIAQFIVTVKGALPDGINYSLFAVMGLFIILSVYLSWSKNQTSKIVFWAFCFNIAFIVISLFFHYYSNLFIGNASAWRAVYLTSSIGNYSTYTALFTLFLCEILDANKSFLLSL